MEVEARRDGTDSEVEFIDRASLVGPRGGIKSPLEPHERVTLQMSPSEPIAIQAAQGSRPGSSRDPFPGPDHSVFLGYARKRGWFAPSRPGAHPSESDRPAVQRILGKPPWKWNYFPVP